MQNPILMNGTRLAVSDAGALAVANPDGTPIAAGGAGGYVAKATAVAPAYTEGTIVPLSVDLAGTLRSTAGAGGGSGGAVTVADGADVAQGTTTDAAWTTGAGTVVGLLKAVVGAIKATLTADVTDRAARLLGHVTVDNASIPVTGSFWQTTQPVSGTVTSNDGGAAITGQTLEAGGSGASGWLSSIRKAITDRLGTLGQKTMAASTPVVIASDQSTVPVSGTFWQATQPVSGTVASNQGTANTVANAWPVKNTDGTNTAAVKAASTAAAATDPALVVSISPNSPATVNSGSTFILTNIANTTANTAPVATLQGLVVALSPNVSTAGNTRDVKDSNRSSISLNWEEMVGTAAAESALTNFTSGAKAAASLTAASSYTVTAGKTLRITSINLYLKNTSTTLVLARFRLRQAASAIANTSPIIWDYVLGSGLTTAASGVVDHAEIAVPDGLEVAAGQQITFTWFTSANSCTVGLTLTGFEY